MEFFHGTNGIIGTINLGKSRLRTDFGKGFYFADKRETAQGWAVRKAQLHDGTPTVLRYDISGDVLTLHGKRFDNTPTLEWLEFICSNRRFDEKDTSKTEPRHGYNWVSGLIANDRIADVVDEYLAGDITADEAIRRARALPQTYQLSLHTMEAVNFVDDQNVFYKQFKNGRWSKDWLRRTH